MAQVPMSIETIQTLLEKLSIHAQEKISEISFSSEDFDYNVIVIRVVDGKFHADFDITAEELAVVSEAQLDTIAEHLAHRIWMKNMRATEFHMREKE